MNRTSLTELLNANVDEVNLTEIIIDYVNCIHCEKKNSEIHDVLCRNCQQHFAFCPTCEDVVDNRFFGQCIRCNTNFCYDCEFEQMAHCSCCEHTTCFKCCQEWVSYNDGGDVHHMCDGCFSIVTRPH